MIRPLSCSFPQTLAANLQLTHSPLIVKLISPILLNFWALTWRKHIDYTNSKLPSLGYILHSLRSVLSLKIIKQVYSAYVHSILNYGIIFWGNSSYCRTIFITQKRIVRIIMKAKARDSCREMFSKLGILTLYSQYIFSTLMFVIRHKDILYLQ